MCSQMLRVLATSASPRTMSAECVTPVTRRPRAIDIHAKLNITTSKPSLNYSSAIIASLEENLTLIKIYSRDY